MPLIGSAVREDDRMMGTLRRRTFRSRRSYKRQESPPIPEAGDDVESESDGEESSDEGEESADEGEESDEEELDPSPSGSVTSGPTATLSLPFQPSTTLITSATSTGPRHKLSPMPTPTDAATSTLGPAPEAATTGPVVKTRPHTTLSHGATIAIEVIGIGTGVAIFLGICFFLYRRWKRRKLQGPKPPRSLWGGWGSIWGGHSNSTNNTPPTPGLPNLAETNNAVDRQERLGLVRASLLGEKELNGGLMRSHTLTIKPVPAVPQKAFLKKVDGKMVMNRGLGLDIKGNGVFESKERVNIEASGGWEDSVTVARESLSSRGLPARDVRRGVGVGVDAGVVGQREVESGSESGVVERRAERESKISLARWRDPVSWVKDQVERRNNGRVGMERLPD